MRKLSVFAVGCVVLLCSPSSLSCQPSLGIQSGMSLANQQCVPCPSGGSPLKGTALRSLLEQLEEGWEIVDEHHLRRELQFPSFAEALVYVNRVGEMAEEQDHHPDLYLAWGRVRVEVWTHKIDGLTESDFVFAAKTEALYE